MFYRLIPAPICLPFICAMAFLALPARPLAANDAARPALDRDTIYRFDPVAESESDQLLAVPAKELKVGAIYLHYSPLLRRHVWSYVQRDKTFWHAFGEGTTQFASRFDLRQSKEELLDQLRWRNPALAESIARELSPVCLRLDNKGQWTAIGSLYVESIYDAETMLRWEDHFGRYIPVRSLYGGRWRIADGRYKPVRN